MKVVAYDPFVPAEVFATRGRRTGRVPDAAEDVRLRLHSHARSRRRRKGLFNGDTFGQMKRGAYIVNTARGPIIDEAALAEALDAGQIAGAALDVMTQEPPPASPLFGRDNVIITPHTSFYSEESLVELQMKAAQEVVAVLSGKPPRNPVNPEVSRTADESDAVDGARGTGPRTMWRGRGREQGQVLVRVTHSGICGTDYKIFNGAIPVNYPRIMGHEMAGEVVDAGASALRAGDRVIVDPELYCGTCFHCRIGQTHLCTNGMLVGRDRDGGFAEYLTVPPSHVFPLPARWRLASRR